MGEWAALYLDDFLTLGAPDTTEGQRSLRGALDICAPVLITVFLGFELDTKVLTVRLPGEKLARSKREIDQWRGRRSGTIIKRELLSLIGKLQHACCVVRPGRTFVRQVISLATCSGHYTIHLNKGVKSDLQWEATFLYHHGMIEA